MLGWGGVLLTNDASHLRDHIVSGLLVSANEVECSNTLTVETHNLGKGLSDAHFKALVEEVSETISIFVHAASVEALVCSIKEWVELVALASLSNLLPLILSWVNTCWVVGTSVEHHNRAWSSIFKVCNHSSEVKSLCLFVEVAIFANLNSSSSEDRLMVTPGRVADQYWSWLKLSEEISEDAESTSSG